MTSSHVDAVNRRIWSFSILCAFLTFINVIVHLAMSNFANMGYPCAYFTIADYDQLNLSHTNVYHQITPQLYLDSVQTVLYVIFTETVFLMVILYYMACWGKIVFRKDPGMNLNQSSRDITYMGDGQSCFLFIVTMDTFQLYTLTLSFKLPSMISFAFFLYFVCLTAFIITMITQYQSYDRAAFALSRIHPSLTSTVKFKTLILNALDMLLGFSSMVLAMSLSLGVGNNFFVKTGHMVYATVATFAFVMVIYFIVIEALLHRYMKVQIGFYLGSLFGICGMAYPVVKYEAIAASDYKDGINFCLIGLFAIWLIFTICRVIRFCIRRRQKRYKPLHNIEEIKELRTDADDQ